MFKIESYLSPFLLNWLNSYVKLKNEDFKLSLWEGDAVFNKLDLRLEVFQDLLRLPFNIRSGRIQELRIHIPWTKLGSEPICLTINTIEFVLSLPTEEEKSESQKTAGTESLSTEFERSAEFVQPPPQPQASSRQPSYLQALVFKILNNVQITVSNLIVKYVEGDMIVSVNVKSAESWSADADWSKAFVDALPPHYGLRKIANLHDATICVDRCTPSGKIESYNEPFMYRCSLQCRMLFEYPNPFSRIPSSSKLAFFFGEPEFSLADTQLPLLLRIIRTGLTLIYGNNPEVPRSSLSERRSSASAAVVDESERLPQYTADQEGAADGGGWSNWALSYLPGVVSWTTGFQAPLIMPTDSSSGDLLNTEPKQTFTFVGIYARRLTFSLKLSKKHVDPLGTSSRIQFHPCLTVVATDVKSELIWRGDTYFSCSAIVNSLVGKTAGFCTCHVRDEGEQVIVCGPLSPTPLTCIFDEVLSSTAEIPNNADEHLLKYSDERISEMQPAFMLDFITDVDKSREKPEAPLEELQRFQRVIFRWFVYNPTVSLTGGLFHRMTKFLSHAQKSEFDLFSSVRSGQPDEAGSKAATPYRSLSTPITSLDFNVCGRSDRVHIQNITIFIALNNHPCASPGKHSGIFAQRLSQIGSPLRLFAGKVIVAKTEPLYQEQIGHVLKSYSGPLNEEVISPCCAQYVMECSSMSIDLPSESGATFAIACGLSFSVTAKNYEALDASILKSLGLAVDSTSFTMPGISLTFNYPALLYFSLLMSSYAVYDEHSLRASTSGSLLSPSPNVASGLEVMTTALLGMIYASSQESFCFSTGNISLQRADFAYIPSKLISCLSVVLSSVRLDMFSQKGTLIPIISFTQSDIPSAAVFVQWEPLNSSVHYILASFSPLVLEFSVDLNNVLLSVDLTRFLDGTSLNRQAKQDGESRSVYKGAGSKADHPQSQHQSAFRLLADLLASETVSTCKPPIVTEKPRIARLVNAIRGCIVNVHIGCIRLNLLDQLAFLIPLTTVSTPTGFKRLFTQQLFKLAEPLEVSEEETMLWTVKLEQMSMTFGSHQILNPPLTAWATLSAIQSADEAKLGDNAKSTENSSVSLAQHQLSFHVNVETISISIYRSCLRNISRLQATILQTLNVVSSQLTILPSASSPLNTPPSAIGEDSLATSLKLGVQFWLQVTVPRAMLSFYPEDESAEERRINFILETGAISVDSHPLYQKVRLKFQSLHGETEHKKSPTDASWQQDTSYFFLTNTQLFEFNSYQLPLSSEIGEDEPVSNVGDDFVVSITIAKVRDVFLRIHDPPRTDHCIARTTSGELFSPSLVGGNASGSCAEANGFSSGIAEVCISLPNMDVILSQKAVDLIAGITNDISTPQTNMSNPSDDTYCPVIYLNSGVIRCFFSLHSSLPSSCPLDFLLVCCRFVVTSEVEFGRSRRQTLAVDGTPVSGGIIPTQSSIAVGQHNAVGHCENHMQISLEQLSAYVGTWSTITRSGAGSLGRLSPYVLNNPALHWNLKPHEPTTHQERTDSCLFAVLTAPIDVVVTSSSASTEVILKQVVDVQLILDIVPALCSWIISFSSFNTRTNASSIENKTSDLTVLCPGLSVSFCSFSGKIFKFLPHVKLTVCRPQLVQHSNLESALKVTCHNVELSVIHGVDNSSFVVMEATKTSGNLFTPVIVISIKPSLTYMTIHEPIAVRLSTLALAELSDFFDVVRDVSGNVSRTFDSVRNSDVIVANSQFNIDSTSMTVSLCTTEVTAQLFLSSLSVSSCFATTQYYSRSRFHVKIKRLLSYLTNYGLRYEHCILQPLDADLFFDRHSCLVGDKMRLQTCEQLSASISATPVILSFTDECISIANEFSSAIFALSEHLVSTNTDSFEQRSSEQHKLSDVFFTSHDDLRSEAVRYTFVSQPLVSACDSGVIPVSYSDPGQVFIATDGLLWSYNEPRLLSKIQLSPLPFTIQGDQEVICVLQRFNNAIGQFEPVVSFRLPTEKSLSLPIEQNYTPSMSYRVLLKQPVAPPSSEKAMPNITAISPNETVPPPATLAACCCVDSCFSGKLTPTVTARLSFPKIEFSFAHCMPSVTSAVSAACLPFSCSAAISTCPPQQLLAAVVKDLTAYIVDAPESGVTCECRFSAAISCKNPRDLSYCDILDSVVRLNTTVSDRILALDLDVNRLNLLADELLLRNLYGTISHVLNMFGAGSQTSAEQFSFQIPNVFLCNITNGDLNLSEYDSGMPSPDICIPAQKCAPFYSKSIYLSSKEWPVPLNLPNWSAAIEKKVVRVMPNDSHAVVVSKQAVTCGGSTTVVSVLSVSSSFVIANCLNASFSVICGKYNFAALPLTLSPTSSDFMLRDDLLTMELATADGFWVSSESVTLRLKSGSFSFVSMRNTAFEGSAEKQATRNAIFTVVVSLVVEKIESFFHVLLLILPPFVLENDLPAPVNAILTNPHRGKVVCLLDDTSCPYPFCDIVQHEMVHMASSLAIPPEDETNVRSSPITFSLEALTTLREGFVQPEDDSIETAIRTIAKWMKSPKGKADDASKAMHVISPNVDIQILSTRLFQFAPTVALRCIPGIKIINETSLSLVMLGTDGSAISLNSKATIHVPQLGGGIKLGYFDANVLWQSKPIDIIFDMEKDDVMVVEDDGDTEAYYKDNFSSDRVTLLPNRSCRLSIIVSSQNVECLLVVSSQVNLIHGATQERDSTVITIRSFLSVANRSKHVTRVNCFNQLPSSAAVPFYAGYSLGNASHIVDIPFLALSSAASEPRYHDSMYISLAEHSSHYLRLSYAVVPFRYVTTISQESLYASIAIGISPADEATFLSSKRLVVAIYDNPFHDVTLCNMCDFNVYVREASLAYDEVGNTLTSENASFCIPPGANFEFGFTSAVKTDIQLGVDVPASSVTWSDIISLPTVLCSNSNTLNSNGLNIVSFGQKSACDLQISVNNYCDTIPQVVIKTLIKALVTKQEKRNVVVQPAARASPLSSRDDDSLVRRSSSASRTPEAVNLLSPSGKERTRTLQCRFENVQVLFTTGETMTPCYVASLDGLSFGASIFATRGSEAREATAGTYQVSARSIQLDNYLDSVSKPAGFAFPVILHSSSAADSSYCFRLHGTLLSRLGETTITSLALSPGSFSVFIQDVNIRDFVNCILRLVAIFERPEVPGSVDTVAFWHPLPLRSFSIDPCHLDLTLRASLYVYIATNQTPLSLGAFKLVESSLTWSELVHKLTTFYVRGAIFRAGLLFGSLNIIGRPLSLVRTTTHAVRDICYSPFSGRGVLRTASNAARSVLTDAILSVADFAESLGRNVDQFSSRPPLSPAQPPESFFSGLKQGFTALGISIVGAIGGLAGRPMEEILAALESIDRNFEPGNLAGAASQPSSSLTSLARVSAAATRGVGLGLVGLVTQPMAGLSDFVAITGHGLLNTVGQSNLQRVASVQLFFSRAEHVDPRNILYRIEHTLASLNFAGGHIIAMLQAETMTTFVLLCQKTISLFDMSERILQQTFFISDIDVIVDQPSQSSNGCCVFQIFRRKVNRVMAEEEFDDTNANNSGLEENEADLNKWRVEAYLASSAGPLAVEHRSTDHSPPIFGLYSASLMHPQWRSKQANSLNVPSSQLQTKSSPLCSVTIHPSCIIDNNVDRFLTIFYYLRDACRTFHLGKK